MSLETEASWTVMGISGLSAELMMSSYLLGLYTCHSYRVTDCQGEISYLSDIVIKGFFSSSRYRIGPFEVESALIEHPAVVESAVVSSPDPIRGEVE